MEATSCEISVGGDAMPSVVEKLERFEGFFAEVGCRGRGCCGTTCSSPFLFLPVDFEFCQNKL